MLVVNRMGLEPWVEKTRGDAVELARIESEERMLRLKLEKERRQGERKRRQGEGKRRQGKGKRKQRKGERI